MGVQDALIGEIDLCLIDFDLWLATFCFRRILWFFANRHLALTISFHSLALVDLIA